MMDSRSVLAAVLGDFRACWKSLLLTDIAYKIIAFVMLTPLAGIRLSDLDRLLGQDDPR